MIGYRKQSFGAGSQSGESFAIPTDTLYRHQRTISRVHRVQLAVFSPDRIE